MLLPTSLVGSYPQPEWLIDREKLSKQIPRVRADDDQVPADRLVVAPDCGMKYLPRAVAFGKMKAMAAGAALVRREFGG